MVPLSRPMPTKRFGCMYSVSLSIHWILLRSCRRRMRVRVPCNRSLPHNAPRRINKLWPTA